MFVFFGRMSTYVRCLFFFVFFPIDLHEFLTYFITVNIHATNIGAPKYLKQISTELKEEIDSNITVVGYFSVPPFNNAYAIQTENKQIQSGLP